VEATVRTLIEDLDSLTPEELRARLTELADDLSEGYGSDQPAPLTGVQAGQHYRFRRPVIRTNLGIPFDLHAPSPEKVCLHDIAWGLSMTCRYGGQCDAWYSVAEHSLLMSTFFAAQGDRDAARLALLHDASEAYLGDFAGPYKRMHPSLIAAEDRIQRCIELRFGIADTPEDVRRAVKAVDVAMLDLEFPQIFDHTPRWVRDRLTPQPALEAAIAIDCLPPGVAYELFLARFKVLFGDTPYFRVEYP